MTIHLGDVPSGSTLYIPFCSYGKTNGESITLTGLAVTDIEIYKNGSTTQRSSDNGYALLDTDGIDFDGITGLHGFSVDLSDNSDANFYAAGAFYWVVVSTVTIDSQTITFVAATFRIRAADAAAGVPKVDVDTIKTNPVVNGGTITFPTNATVASTTNITSATGVDVTKWLGGTCPAVNTTGVPIVDTKYITGTLQTAKDVGSLNLSSGKVLVQGTIDQFDDVFTAAGKLAALDNGTITAAVIADAAIDNATFAADVGSTAIATNVIGIAAKKGVVDALNVDTYAEPGQGTPPATATIVQRLQYLYKNWRNRKLQTSTQWSLLNDDAATVDHKATVADDGTTASKGEIATGP